MNLRRADRCDACGAQAIVVAQLWAGPLFFCGHHFDQHHIALAQQALEIIDTRLAPQ